jgi:hypothetical protein
MEFLGNMSVQSDMPDGYYLEYGLFDDSKNLWITRKVGEKDHLFLCLASCVHIEYDYDEDDNVTGEKSREYDTLIIEDLNPPRVMDLIPADEEDDSIDRLLFRLDKEELSLHLLMDLV